ncbi:MAG: LLM class F420-dependent oxidoreductase [Chloroflexota bacterium]|nr:LLM class F420-dependent oxidoreductase [Chloroflexota bacterium]
MEIGLNMAILSTSAPIADIARFAETLGFESIWLPEHTIMPSYSRSKYAGTADGSIPDYMSDLVDPYIGLSSASSCTTKLKLGTGISLIPERNPLLLAKTISSLDLFSSGRFILGVGGGWLREETEIMGGDFPNRWPQIRESILAMKQLWTQEESEFHGDYYDFPAVKCYPKPFQNPHPPVLLGGSAKNVYQRVIEYADGWIPVGLGMDEVAQGKKTLTRLAEENGRDPSSIQITVYGQPPDSAVIEAWEQIGVDRVIVRLSTTLPDNYATVMENIAAEIL